MEHTVTIWTTCPSCEEDVEFTKKVSYLVDDLEFDGLEVPREFADMFHQETEFCRGCGREVELNSETPPGQPVGMWGRVLG